MRITSNYCPRESSTASVGVVSKVLLKAVGSAKRDSKTFTLLNVDTISVNMQEKLKLLIRTQLH